jgi:phenylacetyl-CoA:acceptor oxidoreductase subunit 2
MSRELWAVLLFGSATLISLVWPHGFFFAWAGVAALLFLVCQAKILQTARGIPNWRLPLVPWIVIATGLLEGTSLLGLIAASQLPAPFMGGRDTVGLVLPIAGVVIVLLNAGLWTGYRMTARAAGIGPGSRAVIAKASLSLDLVGHGLPLLMFLLAFYMPGSAATFLVIGGVAAIVGGIFKKFTLIVRAGYQQGYALAMLPQRGSGTKAASGLSNIKSSPASTRVYAASGF